MTPQELKDQLFAHYEAIHSLINERPIQEMTEGEAVNDTLEAANEYIMQAIARVDYAYFGESLEEEFANWANYHNNK